MGLLSGDSGSSSSTGASSGIVSDLVPVAGGVALAGVIGLVCLLIWMRLALTRRRKDYRKQATGRIPVSHIGADMAEPTPQA